MSTTFVLLLLAGTALAATNVNISIQHPVTNPADVTYLEGKAPAELKAGPAEGEQHHHADFSLSDDGKQEFSAKLQAGNNRAVTMHSGSNMAAQHHASAGYDGARAGRVQESAGNGHVQFRQHHQGFAGRQLQQGQFRRPSAQDKQNMEFERYIQSYHSGPTVETVFESASPSGHKAQQQTSSVTSSSSSGASQRLVAIGSRPSQQHTFERQVALPVSAPKAVAPSADQSSAQAHVAAAVPAKASVDAAITQQSAPKALLPSNTKFDLSLNTGNFDAATSYNKPHFDESNYSYADAQQSDLHNQYPPSVDEPHGGYGGYYSHNEQPNFYSAQSQSGYSPVTGFTPQQPTYQRPLVTKTIQIAQPALKAKKYEVRHPAIQKEFYDIEERVVIKPAGTIVVELERPVAKIPRGETILPLGHPHPAVAGAYNNGHGAIQTESSSTGSYNNAAPASALSNQYGPSPVYKANHPTTIASKVTATPTYDQGTKNDFVEANLNRQYKDGAQAVATTEPTYTGTNKEYFSESHDNQQHHAPAELFTSSNAGKDETDTHYPAHVEINNNGAPSPSSNQQSSFNYNAPSQPQLEANFNDGHKNNDEFKGEYFTGEFYNNANNPQDRKPARLQQQPLEDAREAPAQVIKHEHNIHIPPSQHNIYLGRLEQSSAPAQFRDSRYQEEAARVLELKPYLRQHKAPVVVYASTTVRPAANIRQTERHVHPFVKFRGQLRSDVDGAGHRVHYSAPYSNMRYLPQEPSRLTSQREDYEPLASNAKLIAEDAKVSEQLPLQKADVKEDMSQHPQTHIQIQIPNQSHEMDKPIVVSSTIMPPRNHQRSENYRKLAATPYASNSEVERFNPEHSSFHRGDQEYGAAPSANLESGPDCDKSLTRDSHYEAHPSGHTHGQQKFMRLVETPSASSKDSAAPVVSKVSADDVDVNVKGSSGHMPVSTHGQRVIAATPAPTDAASARESFHKRRIVVNHPFQTVREVVEHEPITNYHQIQVNEPASPALYHHHEAYYQPHGAIRQFEPVGDSDYFHHSAQATHGNLQYAPQHEVGITYHQYRQA